MSTIIEASVDIYEVRSEADLLPALLTLVDRFTAARAAEAAKDPSSSVRIVWDGLDISTVFATHGHVDPNDPDAPENDEGVVFYEEPHAVLTLSALTVAIDQQGNVR